jgi:predicted dehydrogenase
VDRKLDQPQSLGYSCAGTVIAVGTAVSDIKVGDRVACAGANYAIHAEVVSVPRNLVAKIPDAFAQQISGEAAAFTTVGTIAMHGFRLAEIDLGETVAVIGLGLIGLITVQLARAAGCKVIGTDPDPRRCELALRLGCSRAVSSEEEFKDAAAFATESVGVDAVIITAATASNGPVELAGEIARSRATVVAVGAVGTELPRRSYFEKELDFRISRSYGPGRYDVAYEEKGNDYPIDYVRWTENRNMAAFLELIGAGKLDVQSLISHRFTIEDATQAYDLISGKTSEPFLGVVLTYSPTPSLRARVDLRQERSSVKGSVNLGFVGAGNFAAGVLLPAFKELSGVAMQGLCTGRGATSRFSAEKFGFAYCTTAFEEIVRDENVNAVVIATRHDLHAQQTLEALSAGKHVFCEKPLCLHESELIAIRDLAYQAAGILMVGFNRRFSPMVSQIRGFFSEISEPLLLTCRVNGGMIPKDSWIQDPQVGGGRILGEVCHFVDLLSFLAGSSCVSVHALGLPDSGKYNNDNVAVTLEFANGSAGQICYSANGDKSLPKERVEVHGGGATAILEDFRSLTLSRNGKASNLQSRLRQDKGHRAECKAFVEAIRSGAPSPTSLDSIVNTTLATIKVLESLRTGARLPVGFALDDLA